MSGSPCSLTEPLGNGGVHSFPPGCPAAQRGLLASVPACTARPHHQHVLTQGHAAFVQLACPHILLSGCDCGGLYSLLLTKGDALQVGLGLIFIVRVFMVRCVVDFPLVAGGGAGAAAAAGGGAGVLHACGGAGPGARPRRPRPAPGGRPRLGCAPMAPTPRHPTQPPPFLNAQRYLRHPGKLQPRRFNARHL